MMMEEAREPADVPSDTDGTHHYYDVWYNTDTPGTVALNNKFIHFKSHNGAQLKLHWENIGKCNLHNPPVILTVKFHGTGNTASFEIRDCRHIDELKRQLDECMTPDSNDPQQEGTVTRRESEADPVTAPHGQDDFGSPRKNKYKDPIEDPKERMPNKGGFLDPDPDCLWCCIIILILLIILIIGLILIFKFVVYGDDDVDDDDGLRTTSVLPDIGQEDGLFVASNNSGWNATFPPGAFFNDMGNITNSTNNITEG